jgi:hypothetical protein
VLAIVCRGCEERGIVELFNYETGAGMNQKPLQLLVFEEGDYERTGLPH